MFAHMAWKLVLTAFGILYGLVVGLPLIWLMRALGGDGVPDNLGAWVGWWFGCVVVGGLFGRILFGRPRGYLSYYIARRLLLR